MATPPKKLPIILALGTVQTLAFGSTLYLPAILAEPMANDLGFVPGLAFGAFSLALIVAALLGPVAGARIDRFGGRNVMTISSLVLACGLALLGLAQGITGICIAWLVIGIGMATGLYESAFATLTGIFGRDARGPITGITLIAGFASTICWPISAWFEIEYGWRITCFFWAGMHIVLALPLNRFLIPSIRDVAAPAPTHQDHTGAHPRDQDNKAQTSAVFNSSQSNTSTKPSQKYFTLPMFLLAFVFAASWFTATAMAAHLPRMLQISGLSTADAIIAASLVGPAQVIGRLLEFGFLQRMHPLISARLASITHPLGAAILLIFGGPAAMIFTCLHGTGNGILTIAKGTLPLAMFGPNGYGRRQGFLMAPSRFAQAAAPFLFGILIDGYGVQALWLTGGLGLLTLLALMNLKAAASKKDGI
ncbi:MFS transporter [Thalassospira alkalitolerans]|uniref:MFS transporter n=1 Tax=Thalassospira alkalitolerans TaxID=1293890 RepID=UPI0030EE29B4|tara:strand:- start:3348 stop:4610 length:1263 start_codon:yes stop_codon:yes gene_type:complete